MTTKVTLFVADKSEPQYDYDEESKEPMPGVKD